MWLNFNGPNMNVIVISEVFSSVGKVIRLWIVLLYLGPVMSGQTWQSSTNPTKPLKLPPNFDGPHIKDVYAKEGQTILLPCSIRNLGDKVVSWIRSRDLHILTSADIVFASDNRFESVPSEQGVFWGLRIRGVRYDDTGQYECQINTDPKMSLAINLTVTDAMDFESVNSKWLGEALIKGPSKVYVQDGSPVTFTCEISPNSLSELSLQEFDGFGLFMTQTRKPQVRWLHDNKELLFEIGESGMVSLETHYGEENGKVTSLLKLTNVSWRDSGQYTCLQLSAKPASVRLIVIEAPFVAGEHSEAMQRDFPLTSNGTVHTLNIMLTILLLFIFSFSEKI